MLRSKCHLPDGDELEEFHIDRFGVEIEVYQHARHNVVEPTVTVTCALVEHVSEDILVTHLSTQANSGEYQ